MYVVCFAIGCKRSIATRYVDIYKTSAIRTLLLAVSQRLATFSLCPLHTTRCWTQDILPRHGINSGLCLMSLYPRRDTLELASYARDFFATLIALEGHGTTSLLILWIHPSRHRGWYPHWQNRTSTRNVTSRKYEES